MAKSEMVLFSDSAELEQDLENKREINRRVTHGVTVVAYWLVREQVCTIFVHDAARNDSAEFEVPSDEVMEHFNHPFANPNTWMLGEYDEPDGA